MKMQKWVLISVFDREIFLMWFDTYEEAVEQRNVEMACSGVDPELFKDNEDYEENADDWEDNFGFHKYGGYSNLNGYERNWRIASVDIKLENKNADEKEICTPNEFNGFVLGFTMAYMTAYDSLKNSFDEDLREMKNALMAKEEKPNKNSNTKQTENPANNFDRFRKFFESMNRACDDGK